jgi:tetraacyldisaccharide 4'-kinase
MALQRAWYPINNRKPIWIWLLLPLTMLFWLLSRLRAYFYAKHIMQAYKSALPVIVVGNISVGGNGKTPVVLAIANHLQARGIKCAVLSRGYGGAQTEFPYLLTHNSSATQVGDEPALIHKRLNIPVVIDPKRARGAKFIERHTQAQVIICDDGLQHYALARDIELCVMDKRGVGNGYLLPMGPLRESLSRLKTIDWLLFNGAQSQTPAFFASINTEVAYICLESVLWINVKTDERLDLAAGLAHFAASDSVAAMAGIGDPSRFFSTLASLNISLSSTKGLPDHHAITQVDIPVAEFVLMTEKDAIKCRDFAPENCWYLQVQARIPHQFYEYIDARLANLERNSDNKVREHDV